MSAELSGEVEVQTTTGTRNGVPVIIQTRTITINATENGVVRRELHVVETEQPLLPLLKAEQERRQAAQREAFNRAFERDLLRNRSGARPGDRPADRRDTVTPEYPSAFSLPRGVLLNHVMP